MIVTANPKKYNKEYNEEYIQEMIQELIEMDKNGIEIF